VAYLLALDQGTTSSRAIIFREDSSIVATAQQEFEQHFPHSGWVEHDANDLLTTQLNVAKEVLNKAQLKASDIAAIGITNQRETTVFGIKQPANPCTKPLFGRTAERPQFVTRCGRKAIAI
jgi:glycerol kinase